MSYSVLSQQSVAISDLLPAVLLSKKVNLVVIDEVYFVSRGENYPRPNILHSLLASLP